MRTDPPKWAHNTAHIFFWADDVDSDAKTAYDAHGGDVYEEGHGGGIPGSLGIQDWYTNFPIQDNSAPNLGRTCLFTMVR